MTALVQQHSANTLGSAPLDPKPSVPARIWIGPHVGSAPRTAWLTELSGQGFSIPAIAGIKTGDPLAVEVPGIGVVSARVRTLAAGRVGCEFIEPLPRIGIDTVRDEPQRWPRRTRMAVMVGGAAGLWGLVALALR